jgi:hypothetical protein
MTQNIDPLRAETFIWNNFRKLKWKRAPEKWEDNIKLAPCTIVCNDEELIGSAQNRVQ